MSPESSCLAMMNALLLRKIRCVYVYVRFGLRCEGIIMSRHRRRVISATRVENQDAVITGDRISGYQVASHVRCNDLARILQPPQLPELR